jgi:hypothetical protein
MYVVREMNETRFSDWVILALVCDGIWDMGKTPQLEAFQLDELFENSSLVLLLCSTKIKETR